MEEAALYRAVLAAPHDDTPRLALADYLDESAAALPEPEARLARGRAELIRVGCALARAGFPWHWGRPLRNPALDPMLVWRAKRLRFLHSAKLRHGLPEPLASARFDRGFLRPLVWMRPYEFLRESRPGGLLPTYDPTPPLPADHPMRRYVPGDSPLDAAPLWDVHLYARPDDGDPYNLHTDRGQYGELLGRCARSPALERVGWLKVSFFRTSTFDFFRAGNFANVEALELNCRPFPAVLEAVAGNESFRSLRYVTFGGDSWAWAPTPSADARRAEIGRKLSELNGRNLPYGEMRRALRELLDGLPVVVPQRPVVRARRSTPQPPAWLAPEAPDRWAEPPRPGTMGGNDFIRAALVALILFGVFAVLALRFSF